MAHARPSWAGRKAGVRRPVFVVPWGDLRILSGGLDADGMLRDARRRAAPSGSIGAARIAPPAPLL